MKYVKFWFKEWYGKDKGDVMSFRIQDALKRLYMERVGQNRASSSSGSGSNASLSKDSEPSVGNASNTVEALIYTQNWLKDAKKKRPIKLRECMDNVEDIDGFEIDTGIYVCVCVCVFIFFVVCINCLFICSMLKNHFVLNEIVEIASVCPMPMEEDPSIIVLDDDE